MSTDANELEVPGSEATEQAARAVESLQAYIEGHHDGHRDAMASLQLCSAHGPGDEPGATIELPTAAVALLRQILAELANGNTVTVAPVHSELTTQQAADFLNVSRPFLVGLLDTKQIPFRRVGNRRRIRLHDVLAYKRREDIHRQRLLDELTAEAEDLGLDY